MRQQGHPSRVRGFTFDVRQGKALSEAARPKQSLQEGVAIQQAFRNRERDPDKGICLSSGMPRGVVTCRPVLLTKAFLTESGWYSVGIDVRLVLSRMPRLITCKPSSSLRGWLLKN